MHRAEEPGYHWVGVGMGHLHVCSTRTGFLGPLRDPTLRQGHQGLNVGGGGILIRLVLGSRGEYTCDISRSEFGWERIAYQSS